MTPGYGHSTLGLSNEGYEDVGPNGNAVAVDEPLSDDDIGNRVVDEVLPPDDVGNREPFKADIIHIIGPDEEGVEDRAFAVTIHPDGTIDQDPVKVVGDVGNYRILSGFNEEVLPVKGGVLGGVEGALYLLDGFALWQKKDRSSESEPRIFLPRPGTDRPLLVFLTGAVVPEDAESFYGFFPVSAGVKILTRRSVRKVRGTRDEKVTHVASAFTIMPGGMVVFFRGNKTGVEISVGLNDEGAPRLYVNTIEGADLMVRRAESGIELAKKKGVKDPERISEAMDDAVYFLERVKTDEQRAAIILALGELSKIKPDVVNVYVDWIRDALNRSKTVMGYRVSGLAGRLGLLGALAEDLFDLTLEELSTKETLADRSKLLATLIELVPVGDVSRARQLYTWMWATSSNLLESGATEAPFYGWLWREWATAADRAKVDSEEVAQNLASVRDAALRGLESGPHSALRTNAAVAMQLWTPEEVLATLDHRETVIPDGVWDEFWKVVDGLLENLVISQVTYDTLGNFQKRVAAKKREPIKR